MMAGEPTSRSALSMYVCYAGLGEPLVQTQVLPYIRELVGRQVRVLLLTFEDRPWSEVERSAARKALAHDGIRWYSLRYHKRPSLPATLFDIAQGSALALGLALRNRPGLLHARSHVAAAIGLVVRALVGCKLLFDMRGLLADEYVDAGHWSPTGLKYRLTKRMERQFFRHADAIVMLTQQIRRELLASEPGLAGRAGRITVIPCCVDTARFAASQTASDTYREERGWSNRRVLVYVGKLGTWYLHREMAEFFAEVLKLEPNAFFAVFTSSDATPMTQALSALGVPASAYGIDRLAPQDVPKALAAADAGISLIQPSYSKKASSPTKVGEYLASGLPVVANVGVGDTEVIFGNGDVGVLLRRLDREEYRAGARALLRLLQEPGLRERCRRVAEEQLSLTRVGGPRYAHVYGQLLADASRVSS